jgi:hypothetical protein
VNFDLFDEDLDFLGELDLLLVGSFELQVGSIHHVGQLSNLDKKIFVFEYL